MDSFVDEIQFSRFNAVGATALIFYNDDGRVKYIFFNLFTVD